MDQPPQNTMWRGKLRYSLLTLCLVVFCGLIAAGSFAYARHTGPVHYALTLPDGSFASTTLQYGAWPALSNPDFYAEVKQSLLDQKASFISADLAAMSLTVYKDGEPALTVPILAKGRKGSWWETPVGFYNIDTKEQSHFSSFGKVYMPWSMEFEGNFFIHGWPSEPDGTPVSSSYSGGCIRLSTDDSEKVYGLASVGMPVLVYDSAQQKDAFQYAPVVSGVTSSSYLVADIQNGTVLTEKDPNAVLPVASVTKLVTALVVTEYLNLDHSVVVPESAIVMTSKPRLVAGQSVTVHDLLFLLLTESSNEAAEALASALGREHFVALMNQKAKAIGLTQSAFVDPSGAGDGNLSSASDLFTLVKYVYQNRRFIFDITADRVTVDAYGPPSFPGLQNFNPVPGVSDTFLGGKIGKTTAAHETYAGVFALPVGTSTRPVAAIVLGADDSYTDIAHLMSFADNLYGSH